MGKEEKEVQNLNLRTTVNEVITAVLKDVDLIKNLQETEKCAETKSQDSESGKGTASESETKSKAENWVLVESWRGIERPLPPRTRLLKGKLVFLQISSSGVAMFICLESYIHKTWYKSAVG